MPLYPLNLQISGRRCLVVGGGDVAARKVSSLLECGASVTVVSPELCPEVEQMAKDGKIAAVQRPFSEEDVAGTVIVIAATNNRSVNESVAAACRARNILVNVVDTPELCDFYVPASFSRGDLIVTISTNGQSPMLAKQIRQALECQFGQEYEPLLVMLGQLRRHLQAHVSNQKRRAELEAQFLESEALSLLAQGRVAEAQRLLDEFIGQVQQA